MASSTEKILQITDLDSDGRGVGRFENLAVFVAGALPGETVSARIVAQKKAFAEAKLLEIITPSSDRVPPPCPHFGDCGGCGLQHLSYPAQLEYKYKKIGGALSRIGKLSGVKIEPVFPCSEPYRYRNKLSIPIRMIYDNTSQFSTPEAGLFHKNSRSLRPLTDCILQPEIFGRVIRLFLGFMRENGVSAYDEKSRKGLVRRLILRTAGQSVMITVVLNGKTLPYKEKLIGKLRADFFDNFSLWLNENTASGAETAGGKYTHISGTKTLFFNILNLKINLHPTAFFQVNDEVSAALYNKVYDIIKQSAYAKNFPNVTGAAGDNATVPAEGRKLAFRHQRHRPRDICGTLIDAYCGAGLLTCYLTGLCEKAIGIEIIPASVADARRLAADNNIHNVEFIEGACEDALPRLLGQSTTHNAQRIMAGQYHLTSALILDPPRAGCSPAVIDAILQNAPALICYISCDPATLARDLFRLKEKYDIVFVQPFDMFPQTAHVETLVCLTLK